MIKEEITTVQLFYLINEFLRKHSKDYSDKEKEFILKNCAWGRKKVLVPDILRQIYDELGIVEESKNVYNGFIDLLAENFDINRNIVEIGGGKIPSLAKKIALRQKSGTITVYDDKLIATKTLIPNLLLKKEHIKKDKILKNADMLVAFMPCDGTETAIHLAKENNLDFMIAFCEGSCHNEIFSPMEENWEQSMIYEARKAVREGKLGNLEIEYMKKRYQNPYPIIYNKR